jgi:peptidoglycan-associated lipoprotein
MKKISPHLFVFSVVTLLFAGCSSTPIATAPAPAPVAAVAPAPVKPPAPAASTVAKVVVPAYLDPNSLISKERSIYFDYDDFSVKADYTSMLERQGKYLGDNAALNIKIEGNADERGGSEYNLALGQKRAEAVRKALKVYGVRDAQMEAVSWGKEKPRNPAHNEAAWQENRRVDLVYPQR